jgi:hypothetical protein
MSRDWRVVSSLPIIVASTFFLEVFHQEKMSWKVEKEMILERISSEAPQHCFGDCNPIPDSVLIFGYLGWGLFLLALLLLVWVAWKPNL